MKWKDATNTPFAEWSHAGAIRRIYGPCMDMLRRLQKAYHEYYGGKRPNMAQITTYALCELSFHLERKCKDLETKVENRKRLAEATAKAAEKDPNSLIVVTD